MKVNEILSACRDMFFHLILDRRELEVEGYGRIFLERIDSPVETLKDSNAVLMEKHGVLAVGPDLETALNKAIIVGESCTQYLTTQLFGKVTNLSKEEMSELCDIIKAWKELKRFKSIKDWETTLSKYGRS